MFRSAANHVTRASRAMFALAVLSASAWADDSEPAAVRWSLYGASETETQATDADAVRWGCEKLRKAPPRSVNSVTKITRCGDQISATANARNYRVSYTVLAHDSTLDHDTTTESSFLIQRKAFCPSASFPHLREDDANRFRYSCWRCPTTELRPQKPRFIDEHTVRWFRGNQCPMTFDNRVADNGQPLPTLKNVFTQKLPVANDLSVADEASFRLLRDAPYGRLAEVQLGSGERIFFVGDGDAGASLTAHDARHGSLVERGGSWVWLTANQTEFRFGADADGFSKVASKRGRDGKLWRYSWQKVASGPATVLARQHRLETLIDAANQRYQFRYDRAGKIASIIMQGLDARERLANARD